MNDLPSEVYWGEALRYLDLGSCWVIFALSGMLLYRYSARSARRALLALALLAGVIGAFLGSVVIWETGHRAPWAAMQRLGHAGVLIWLWDEEFGFAEQGSKLCDWVRAMPQRVRDQLAIVRAWWKA